MFAMPKIRVAIKSQERHTSQTSLDESRDRRAIRKRHDQNPAGRQQTSELNQSCTVIVDILQNAGAKNDVGLALVKLHKFLIQGQLAWHELRVRYESLLFRSATRKFQHA